MLRVVRFLALVCVLSAGFAGTASAEPASCPTLELSAAGTKTVKAALSPPEAGSGSGSARFVLKGEPSVALTVDDLPDPTEIAPQLLTYVAWATTPDGSFVSLGELTLKNGKGKLTSPVPAGDVGILVTAEPYFAVSRPSGAVVLQAALTGRDAQRYATSQTVCDLVDPEYYAFGRGEVELALLLRRDARTPGVLLQARHAREIAALAGAETGSREDFEAASARLLDAERAHADKRGPQAVLPSALESVTASERARVAAEQARAARLAREAELAEQERRAAEVRARSDQEERRRAEEQRARREAELAQEREELRRRALEAEQEIERSRRLLEEERLAAQARRAEQAEQAEQAARGEVPEGEADERPAADVAADVVATERASLEAERAKLQAEGERQAADLAADRARIDVERAEMRSRLAEEAAAREEQNAAARAELEQARREAEQARLEAEIARREAELAAERARIEVERAQLEAERRAAEAAAARQRELEQRTEQRTAALTEAERAAELERMRQEMALDAERRELERQRQAMASTRLANEALVADEQAKLEDERARVLAELEAEQRRLAEERQRLERERDEDAARLRAEEERIAAENRRTLEQEQERLRAELQAQHEARQAALEEEQRRREAARERELEAERERLRAELEAERARVRDEAARQQESLARAAAEDRAAREAAARREREERRQRLLRQLTDVLDAEDSERGLRVNLSGVSFDPGRYELRPEAREKLARLAGILLANPGLSVAVEGHTDSTGDPQSNVALSEKRALAVRDYLVEQGVPVTSITASGFGAAVPIASNETVAGRRANRRIEFLITGDSIGGERAAGSTVTPATTE